MKMKVNKWLFMVLATLVTMLEFSLVFSFGAVFVAMLDKFHTDRSATAVVQSLFVGFTLCFGVISGALITKFDLPLVTLVSGIMVPAGLGFSFFATSIEFLYVSVGIIAGTGVSLGYISAVTVIGRVFTGPTKLLCLTVQTFGSGIAGICYPYFLEWLITQYGLNGTFLILGALTSNKLAFALMCWLNASYIQAGSHAKDISEKNKVMTINREIQTNNDKERNHEKQIIPRVIAYARSLMTTSYVLVLVASGTSISALSGYFAFILDISRWKGLLDSQGLVVFACYSTSNALSRLIPGLCNKENSFALFCFPIFVTVSGFAGHLIILHSTDFVGFAIGSCLNGIAVGGIVSSSVLLVVKIVRPEQVPVATGLLFTVFGLLTVAVGPIFGSFRDRSGSYASVLVIISAAQVLATVLFICTVIFQSRVQLNSKREKEDRSMNIFTVSKS